MRIIYIMMLAVICSAGQVMAKDDGGFGSARFSDTAPRALSDAPPTIMMQSKIDVSPADIEPASGEEDITPDVEILDNTQVDKLDSQTDTYTIKKDLSIR